MKFYFFHLMPYGGLDLDYDKTHESAWVTLPNAYYDPKLGHELYNRYLDELELSETLGFDGVCVNEHHQTAYGMMPAPNVLAGALARRTTKAMICVLGRALPILDNPLTVAEEYAMIDNLTGGRLIAGFVRGLGCEYHASMANPAESLARFREAHDLIIQAWTRPEVFSFNGKFNQLRYVNVLPKPIQKPHPPIWVPGGGSVETWDFCLENDYVYCYLSYSGYENGMTRIRGFWDRAEELGYDNNPYRAGFLQLVVVSETDEQAEKDYAQHAMYFFKKCLHTYAGFVEAPGYRTMNTITRNIRSTFTSARAQQSAEWTWRDYVEAGNIIAGSQATVRDRLREAIKGLNVGHLMVMLHIGSMPKELTMKNIQMFSEEVMPHLQDMWPEWENRWWIKPAGQASREAVSTPGD